MSLKTSLKDLSIALNNHGWHGSFPFLSSLPISVLRNLELEANKVYNRANTLYKAALLTRCYVQHFLSLYIDSEVNHKRHFIKIPFINKGMEFIDLHRIFKDNSVISSIPNYFNNSETPIICYKYNKPIRSTIFNFLGAQWLRGRVLDSRQKGWRFEPHRCHCVVVLEQDTFILA